MLRMMVVEDEKFLLQGICKVGDWSSIGVEICASCMNGREALQTMEDAMPDIVLTDVIMPVMDGIELAKVLYEQYPKVRIIFLSAHEQFQYVKKAMEYKAYNYLLKPVEIEKIMEVVSGVRDEILDERRRENEEHQLRAQVESNLPIVRERYLSDLLNNGRISGTEAIFNDFSRLGIPLAASHITVLLAQADMKPKNFRKPLQAICEECFGRFCPGVTFPVTPERTAALLNLEEGQALEPVLRTIQKELKARFSATVSFGIARAADIDGLPDAYQAAGQVLDAGALMGAERILWEGGLSGGKFIAQAKEYVRTHLTGNVSLIHVAEQVYISPNYLSRLFRESGENFKDFVTRAKMEEAEKLLSHGCSPAKTAALLGYRDGGYLTQVLKKYQEKN